MAFTITRGLVDQQGLTLRVSLAAWSLWMLKRSMWLVARPDRSVLQERGTGPLPEGDLSHWLGRAWTRQCLCLTM